MRAVFVGAGELSVHTARLLVERGYEVVIIEKDRDKIEELSGELDCSFLRGDGSRPHILREADPKHTDLLFCLSDNDQSNIIASLVGRTLGFSRVVTSIQDTEFQNICLELGLKDTIIPVQTISRYLADMAGGVDILELSTIIKGEARFYVFKVRKEQVGKISDLDLPEQARVVCLYREGKFLLPENDASLEKSDEVVLICHSESIPRLRERFEPETADNNRDPEESSEEET